MKRFISACQRCGSANLRMPSLADGVLVGLGYNWAQMACNRCELVAVPLEFEDDKARQIYEAEQAKHPSATWPQSGWPSLQPFDDKE